MNKSIIKQKGVRILSTLLITLHETNGQSDPVSVEYAHWSCWRRPNIDPGPVAVFGTETVNMFVGPTVFKESECNKNAKHLSLCSRMLIGIFVGILYIMMT